MTDVTGKEKGSDSIFEALKKLALAEQGQPPSPAEPAAVLIKKEYDDNVRKGYQELLDQEKIKRYLTEVLGPLQNELISRQDLRGLEKVKEGLRRLIRNPIGAAIVQDFLETFGQQNVDQPKAAARLSARPGLISSLEWLTFQTLYTIGALESSGISAGSTPTSSVIGQLYNNTYIPKRQAVATSLRSVVSEVLPK